jgi:hypothetical protein
MIRIEELVAAVLNEFSIARTKAMLFSAQMAVDFRDHAILGHLPIAAYTISDAEVTIPFIVASTSVEFELSELVAAAQKVTTSLPEQEALKKGLSLDPDQIALWYEAASAIAKRFAADAGQALSLDALSIIYGYLVMTHYLQSLMDRRAKINEARMQAIMDAGYPDALADTARQLMKSNLEKKSSGLAQEHKEDQKKPPRLYVEVTTEKLKAAERVSSLKLHLQEGTLDAKIFSDVKGVGDEEQ